MILEPRYSNLYHQFKEHVKGDNPITPILIGYVKLNSGVVEITRGVFMKHKIWGVTVVKNNKHEPDLSRCFHSYEEVEPYIYKLNYEDTTQLKNLLENLLS